MALWNDSKDTTAAATPVARTPPAGDAPLRPSERSAADPAAADTQRRSAPRADAKESLIAAELTIEGKIQGTGNVRLAGRFKGDVHVEGNVSIDAGAHVDGSVHAQAVVVGGELNGNIEKARHVDILQTGVVVGDVKADSITVAAGSRMRGHVEFGWNEAGVPRLPNRSNGQSS